LYYFDWTYIVFVVPAMIIAMWAQYKVTSTFKKYSTVYTDRRITGREAAMKILVANGLTGVRVERVSGHLTDHFDPKTNVIRLSDSVYDSSSVASVGVAAHEAGHAVQYAVGYSPMKLRAAIIPITNIGSVAAVPLVIAGLVFSFYTLAYAGIVLFGAVVLFQLVTLPVEFNASRRAITALRDSGYFTEEELHGSKKVLSAAAMTYLAALFAALGNMLRLIFIVSGRRGRK